MCGMRPDTRKWPLACRRARRGGAGQPNQTDKSGLRLSFDLQADGLAGSERRRRTVDTGEDYTVARLPRPAVTSCQRGEQKEEECRQQGGGGGPGGGQGTPPAMDQGMRGATTTALFSR